MANQDFLVSESGILGRKREGEGFADEQMILQNNCLLFTNDGWKTLKTALGKVVVGEKDGNPLTAYGLVADVIVGNLLIGQDLAIKNKDISVLIGGDGIEIKNGDNTVFKSDTEGNVLLKGEIEANSGKIGGFLITETELKNDNNTLGLSGSGNYLIWAGGQSNEAKFSVTKDGIVKATDGEFKGEVIAERGKVGGFLINSEILATSGKETGLSGDDPFLIWAGAEKTDEPDENISPKYETAKFSVTNSGRIKATSGEIGGFEIGENYISSGNIVLKRESGNIVATNIEATETGTVNSLLVRKITGNINNDTYLDFEPNANALKEITAEVKHQIIKLGGGNDPGSATITVTTSENLLNSKTFKARLTYYHTHSSPSIGGTSFTHYVYDDKYITVDKGKKTSTINVAARIRAKCGSSYEDNILKTVTIEPTKYYENTGERIKSIVCNGSFFPAETSNSNTTGYLLGDDDHIWNSLRLHNSPQITSDIREKNNIRILSPEYDVFFDNLIPSSFKYNNSDSGRTHIGYIAQDVEKALLKAGLTTKEFAGLCIGNDEKQTYGLRYEEFTALNTYEIQKIKNKLMIIEDLLRKSEIVKE